MSGALPEIRENRDAILERIDAAAKRAGRVPSDISLVAVSKRQPLMRLRSAFEAGQTVFGENRVKEAQSHWDETYAFIRHEIELRLIGPLQTNKVADAVKLFDVIETLDREKLARKIADEASKQDRMPRLLVQVNTGEEDQKSGVSPKGLPTFLKTLRKDYDLNIEGLMCIPPIHEAAGLHFALLAKLAGDHGLDVLSMGMSEDYELAVELGATHIRVGTAFFGERESTV